MRRTEENTELQRLADAVARASARGRDAHPVHISAGKLVAIATQRKADDPAGIVSDVLADTLLVLDHTVPLEAYLVQEVKRRSQATRTAQLRRSRTAKAAAVEAPESTDVDALDQDPGSAKASLTDARTQAIRAAAAVGLAEKYIQACEQQKRSAPDPAVLNELRAYEASILLRGEYSGPPLKRQTREKIATRLALLAAVYKDILVAWLVLRVWRARATFAGVAAQMHSAVPSGVARSGIAIAVAAMSAALVRIACVREPPPYTPAFAGASATSALKTDEDFGEGIRVEHAAAVTDRAEHDAGAHSRLRKVSPLWRSVTAAGAVQPFSPAWHGALAQAGGTFAMTVSGSVAFTSPEVSCEGQVDDDIVLMLCEGQSETLVLGWIGATDRGWVVRGSQWDNLRATPRAIDGFSMSKDACASWEAVEFDAPPLSTTIATVCNGSAARACAMLLQRGWSTLPPPSGPEVHGSVKLSQLRLDACANGSGHTVAE